MPKGNPNHDKHGHFTNPNNNGGSCGHSGSNPDYVNDDFTEEEIAALDPSSKKISYEEFLDMVSDMEEGGPGSMGSDEEIEEALRKSGVSDEEIEEYWDQFYDHDTFNPDADKAPKEDSPKKITFDEFLDLANGIDPDDEEEADEISQKLADSGMSEGEIEDWWYYFNEDMRPEEDEDSPVKEESKKPSLWSDKEAPAVEPGSSYDEFEIPAFEDLSRETKSKTETYDVPTEDDVWEARTTQNNENTKKYLEERYGKPHQDQSLLNAKYNKIAEKPDELEEPSNPLAKASDLFGTEIPSWRDKHKGTFSEDSMNYAQSMADLWGMDPEKILDDAKSRSNFYGKPDDMVEFSSSMLKPQGKNTMGQSLQFGEGSPERAKLQKAMDYLKSKTGKDLRMTDGYEDYGANMMWTNLLDHTKNPESFFNDPYWYLDPSDLRDIQNIDDSKLEMLLDHIITQKGKKR